MKSIHELIELLTLMNQNEKSAVITFIVNKVQSYAKRDENVLKFNYFSQINTHSHSDTHRGNESAMIEKLSASFERTVLNHVLSIIIAICNFQLILMVRLVQIQ